MNLCPGSPLVKTSERYRDSTNFWRKKKMATVESLRNLNASRLPNITMEMRRLLWNAFKF